MGIRAYSSRFDTRARVAISSVLVAASPRSRKASNAAVRMRSRTVASLLSFALDIGTKWYHTEVETVPIGTNAKGDGDVTATRILWKHRLQRDRVGDRRG